MSELELLHKVLTLSHLKNLIGVARRMNESEEDAMERYADKLAELAADPNS